MVLKVLSLLATFLIALTITLEVLSAPPPDVGLVLAKSCVGEAGFQSVETGECAAIMHIYRKRAVTGSMESLYRTARKYSAAVKHRDDHPNRWVLGLNRALKKPRGWSGKLSWERHRPFWERALNHADAFLAGKVEDPAPTALHYGGRMDRYRLSPRVWRRMKDLDFLNIFYEPASK